MLVEEVIKPRSVISPRPRSILRAHEELSRQIRPITDCPHTGQVSKGNTLSAEEIFYYFDSSDQSDKPGNYKTFPLWAITLHTLSRGVWAEGFSRVRGRTPNV